MKPLPIQAAATTLKISSDTPDIGAFEIFEKLSNGPRSEVYRARQLSDGGTVIIKGPGVEMLRGDLCRTFAREIEIAEHLVGAKGAAQIIASRSPHLKPLIVYRDHGAVSMDRLLLQGNLSIMQKIAISVKIADALAQIHARNVVHRDINPSNIVYDMKNAAVEIIDFGIARLHLPGQDASARLAGGGHMEGTLPYVSPEQTGRLAATVTRRSDLYSLGATFYEIFTGRAPFDEKDPQKLIHAHIALKPTPPAKREPSLPLALANIIMKLLEKRPQDRYQSAQGVKADLQKCLHQWSLTGTIDPFILGSKDIPDDLEMPEILYGRADEIEILAGCLQSSGTSGAQLVLVTGEAGAGKSALIHELVRPMVGCKGRFIEGRAEPQNDTQPYAPFIQAVRALIAQMLCGSDEDVVALGHYCEKALQGYAAICARFFPEICDAWPAAKGAAVQPETCGVPLVTVEKIICELLAYAAGSEESPLVLFLDDIQFSDAPTQKLVTALSDAERMTRLVCILALRQSPLEQPHPLERLTAIDGSPIAQKAVVVRISPLGLHESVDMISDIFHLNKDDVFDLAEIVVQKCGGNPKAMRLMLVECTTRGMIAFNPASSRWGWDIAQIRTMPVMDNVVDIMRRKLAALPPESCEVMLSASVWGHGFCEGQLAKFIGCELSAVKKALRDALMAGVIRESSEQPFAGPHTANTAFDGGTYVFVHEQIRDKLYESLDAALRRSFHARIAGILLAVDPELKPGSTMERLAHHLNRAEGTLVESAKLARINYAAHIFAKQKGAAASAEYLAAASAFFAGDQIVLQKKWQSMMALDLMNDAYREASYASAGQYAQRLVTGATHPLARYGAKAMNVALAIREGRLAEAEKMTARWLSQLKTLPEDRRTPQAGFSDLMEGPMADEPLPKEVIRQLLQFVLEAGQGALSRGLLQKIIAYGRKTLHEESFSQKLALFDLHQAILFAGSRKTLGKARSLAQSARQSLEPLWNMGLEGESLILYAEYLHHLSGDHPLNIVKKINGIFAGSPATGLRTKALLAYVAQCLYHGLLTDPLEKMCGQLNSSAFTTCDPIILAGLRDTIARFLGHASQVPAQQPPPGEPPPSYEHWLIALIGMITSYLSDDHARANAFAKSVNRGRAYYRGTIHDIFASYYTGLLMTDCHAIKEHAWGRFTLFARLYRDMSLVRSWATAMPETYQHLFLLLRATSLAAAGRAMAAQRAFDNAIAEGEKGAATHDLALACELAGRFYAGRQRDILTHAYLKKALRLYLLIGSFGKAERLAREFPALGPPQPTPLATTEYGATGVDLQAIREALSAIVSESVAMRMLQKVLEASLRFLGASRGVLILRKEKNRYGVEIEAGADGAMTPYYRAIPLADYKNLPQSLVNYVKRTKKTIIMHKNLAHDESDAFPSDLLGDPYLAETGVKSVLCYPIVLPGSQHVVHSHLVAILYLENRLLDGCFNLERVETLKIICLAAAGRLELSVRASTDGLTGLYNHDHFQNMLHREFLQAQRQSTPLSMLMIDIDHFKTFNDKWGHLAGDRVLKEVAHVIQAQCRKSDIVARYGGEEMAVILPGTASSGALLLAERIRRCIESLGVGCDDNLFQVTASIGIASLTGEMTDQKGLVEAADKALYISKDRGRNCVSQQHFPPEASPAVSAQ